MQFWHDITTEKSWQILKGLRKTFHFVLIGGWAVWLYTKNLKSKDIDLICDYDELQKMTNGYALTKNNRLKKYEIKIEEIDVDIYLPHFSKPGLPVEEIKKHLYRKEGSILPELEVLFILKQQAYLGRRLSLHGQKDKLDLIALLSLEEFDLKKYLHYLQNFDLMRLENDLLVMLKQTREVKELEISAHKMAKIKKKIINKLL